MSFGSDESAVKRARNRRASTPVPQFAEDFPQGTVVEWAKPPMLGAQYGYQWRATGTRALITMVGRVASVRFENSIIRELEPVAVVPGQPCRKVEP